ncbi:hypothetical protein BC834DRAFT_474559 [Gloeopeniophorella convolvens]|nr:hypothetical protein BC834DRAFT_474559 [Gloeopeniophorella convolvens]
MSLSRAHCSSTCVSPRRPCSAPSSPDVAPGRGQAHRARPASQGKGQESQSRSARGTNGMPARAPPGATQMLARRQRPMACLLCAGAAQRLARRAMHVHRAGQHVHPTRCWRERRRCTYGLPARLHRHPRFAVPKSNPPGGRAN